jgi:hypothetical protein
MFRKLIEWLFRDYIRGCRICGTAGTCDLCREAKTY